MAQFGFLLVAVFVIIQTLSTQQVHALRCWSCNSLAPFCNDPFVEKKLTNLEKMSLINCTNGRCVKTIANINLGKPVVSVNRFCANSQEQADLSCLEPGYTYCGSCSSDGCNGSTQYGPIAVMAAIPMTIALIFLF